MGRIISQEMPVQLVVSETGNVLLLHNGPLNQTYSWAQFDDDLGQLHLITEEGNLDNLGLQISASMRRPLHKTNELFIVEVTKDFQYGAAQLVKFAHVG